MNSDRGAWQRPLDFAREEEWSRRARLFRTERTDPALTDQPALHVSPEDALVELIVSPTNLQRAWRQVKGNRGAPGPDGMTIAELEDWAHENWATVRQQLLGGTFFDRVQHDVLMSRVSRKVHDRRLLRLIGRYLRFGRDGGWRMATDRRGLAARRPAIPLLSNVLLDDLDKELERRGLRFVRYADDFQIFVRSERSAHRVFGSVKRFLTHRLKLVVNEDKSSVRPALGCEYLGFTFVGKRVTIKVAPKKLFPVHC